MNACERHSKWVKNWLYKKEKFSHANLFRKLRKNNPGDFENYVTMNIETFHNLHNLVKHRVTKQGARMTAPRGPDCDVQNCWKRCGCMPA
jgi:hypothetical protein